MNNELSKKITFGYMIKIMFGGALFKKDAIEEIAKNKNLNFTTWGFYIIGSLLFALGLGSAFLSNNGSLLSH